MTSLEWAMLQGQNLVVRQLAPLCPSSQRASFFNSDKAKFFKRFSTSLTTKVEQTNQFYKCIDLLSFIIKEFEQEMTINLCQTPEQNLLFYFKDSIYAPLFLDLIDLKFLKTQKIDMEAELLIANTFIKKLPKTKEIDFLIIKITSNPESYIPKLLKSDYFALTNFLAKREPLLFNKQIEILSEMSSELEFAILPALKFEKAVKILRNVFPGEITKTLVDSVSNFSTSIDNYRDIPSHEVKAILEKSYLFIESLNQKFGTYLSINRQLLSLFIYFPENFIQELDPENLQAYLMTEYPLSQSLHFQDLLIGKPHLEELAKEHIIQKLDSVIHDKETLEKILILLPSTILDMDIPEDHPLFLKICQCQILLTNDPSPKNPFKIFNRLRESLPKQEALIDQYRQVRGKSEVLNMDRIRKVRKEYKYKDLPINSFEDLNSIVQTLKSRVEELSTEEKKKIDQELTNEYGNPLATLLDRSTIMRDQTIRAWLSRRGDPDDICDPVIYKLHTLIDYLKNISDNVLPNGLTEKEDLLIQWSESIYNCPSGLRDGIDLIFGSLPIEDSTHAYEEVVDRMTELAVQNKLKLTFIDLEFLKEATGDEIIKQGNHQSLYLINSLYLLVGANHTLSYDAHTHALSDQLVEKDIATLAKIFFKRFTAESLIKHVQLEFTKNLDTKGFSESLSKYFAAKTGKGLYNFLEEIEESDNYTLSEEGAIIILKQHGFLVS